MTVLTEILLAASPGVLCVPFNDAYHYMDELISVRLLLIKILPAIEILPTVSRSSC